MAQELLSIPTLIEPIASQIDQLREIARELANLGPWQTLQVSPAGKYLERRFRVPLDERAILNKLKDYDPSKYLITGARFAQEEDPMILLCVVPIGSSVSPILDGLTQQARGR